MLQANEFKFQVSWVIQSKSGLQCLDPDDWIEFTATRRPTNCNKPRERERPPSKREPPPSKREPFALPAASAYFRLVHCAIHSCSPINEYVRTYLCPKIIVTFPPDASRSGLSQDNIFLNKKFFSSYQGKAKREKPLRLLGSRQSRCLLRLHNFC